MSLKDYIQVVKRRRWMILLTVAVTVIVSVIGTWMMPATYKATASLRIAMPIGRSIVYVDPRYSDQLLNTYAKIATSTPVLQEVAQRLGLTKLPKVETHVVVGTEIMEISVEDQNPALAREAADTLAEVLMNQSRRLYSGGGRPLQDILEEQLAQTSTELREAREGYAQLSDANDQAAAYRSIELKENTYATLLKQYEEARVTEEIWANIISVVEPAVVPSSPDKPRKELNIPLGFVVGCVGGLALALLVENLDSTLQTTEQVAQTTRLSIWGLIPTTGRRAKVALYDHDSPQGRAFQHLCIGLQQASKGTPMRSLLITSAEAGEGKATTVVNLALAMSRSGRSVIAVDADWHQPSLHTTFGLANTVGLSSILSQHMSLDDAIRESRFPGISVLTSGPSLSHDPGLIESAEMLGLIKQLTSRGDVVLLNSTPLLTMTHAAALASVVDGVILVVERGRARKEAVQAACQQLDIAKARALGVVVNRAEQNGSYHFLVT